MTNEEAIKDLINLKCAYDLGDYSNEVIDKAIEALKQQKEDLTLSQPTCVIDRVTGERLYTVKCPKFENERSNSH